MKGQEILTRIINKGGVLGACAKVWINDEEKTAQYIKECADICHTNLANNLWGRDLVKVILKFVRSNAFRKTKLNRYDRAITCLVKKLRESKGVKQDVLALALKMSQSYYCKMENGLKPWTLGHLYIISKELNMTVVEMLTLIPDENLSKAC